MSKPVSIIGRAMRAIKAALAINRPDLPRPDPDDPGFYTYGIGGVTKTIPAAYAAVNILTNTLARLNKVVGRKDAEGNWMMDEEHPVSVLLAHPSPVMDVFQFWSLLLRPYIMNGNTYAVIRRNRAGWPIELLPARANYIRRGENGYLYYGLVIWGQEAGSFARPNFSRIVQAYERDVIALHGPGYDGVDSPSPITYEAATAIQTTQLINQNNASALRDGIHGRSIITSSTELFGQTAEKRKELRDSLKETVGGAKQAGKTVVLPPGYEPKMVNGFSAVDLQLIDLLKWTTEDVCRIWGVPPRMIQHYHEGMRLSGASFEQQAEDFERWSIQPHVAALSAQLTRKLIDRMMPGNERLKVCVDTDIVRDGSFSDKVRAVELAVSRGGFMTINEGRGRLGLPARPDGDRLIAPKGAPTPEPATETNPQNGE